MSVTLKFAQWTFETRVAQYIGNMLNAELASLRITNCITLWGAFYCNPPICTTTLQRYCVCTHGVQPTNY